MRDQRPLAVALFLVLGGCAHTRHGHAVQTPAAPVTPPAPAPMPTPAPVPAEAPPAAATVPKPSSDAAALARPTKAASAGQIKKPPARAPAKSTATVTATAPVKGTSAPQLDFKAMEQRLRETSAIGVFTKLSIKNQVDDLMKAFRGYHAGNVPPTLDELHQRYVGLLVKVVNLVRDDDAVLASSITASQDAIWDRLSNKESFQAI